MQWGKKLCQLASNTWPSQVLDLNPIVNGKNRAPTMRKPFDVLAEGLISKNSRGDKTAIELFTSGIRGWEHGFRRVLVRES
jgi:hypothetical protein